MLNQLTLAANGWLAARYTALSLDPAAAIVTERMVPYNDPATAKLIERDVRRLWGWLSTPEHQTADRQIPIFHIHDYDIRHFSQALRAALTFIGDPSATKVLSRIAVLPDLKVSRLKGPEIGLRPEDGAHVLFHELGHVLERSIDWLFELCATFRVRRQTSNTLQMHTNDLGKPTERRIYLFPGNYISRYVGRVYFRRKSTEVFSCGFERFSDSKRLLEFVLQDPHHFLLVLGVVLWCRGELRTPNIRNTDYAARK
jgi:hypothetical protein